ncbi:MAG: hypothetical protein VYA30_03260 [Myxococcota bacterium]|nr:hypothetical protein [Myxococcota bacterium]
MQAALNLAFNPSTLAQAICQRHICISPTMSRPVRHRPWLDPAKAECIGALVAHRFWNLMGDFNPTVEIQELALTLVLGGPCQMRLFISARSSLGVGLASPFELGELQQRRAAVLTLQEPALKLIIETDYIGDLRALFLVNHALKKLPIGGYTTVFGKLAVDDVLHAHTGPGLLDCIGTDQARPWLASPEDDHVKSSVEQCLLKIKKRAVAGTDDRTPFQDSGVCSPHLSFRTPDLTDVKIADHDHLKHVIKVVFGALFIDLGGD